MIELVGFVVLLLGTVSRAENITCDSKCSTDPTNTTEPCNMTSGECLFGCVQGYAGPNCSVECPSNCSQPLQNNTETCNASTTECLHGCQLGYAGSTCSYDCPKNCYFQNIPKTESCNTSTGECLFGCQHGYAGPNCTTECPSNCGVSEKLSTQTCNETSKMCLFGCLQGYGGQDCKYKCSSNCKQPLTNDTETCSTSSECLLGCISGYAGHKCSFKCPSNCSHSKQNNTNMCNSTTGECLNGCRSGNAGPDCSYICPTNCRLSVSEGTEACNYKSGECLFGCMDGYAGPNCSYPCPANCTISTEDGTDTCNYTTGECLLGCKDGYTGRNCSLQCPENCMFPSENETGTCHPSTKECLHGCNEGFAGSNCVVQCPQNCASIDQSGAEICNSSSAECFFGCKDGFYGPSCTDPCTGVDENCKICVSNQNNSGAICTECNRNFYQENSRCTSCNYYCFIKPEEALPSCREKDGYCEFGCREGRYGNRCGFRCKSQCIGACDRITGKCLNGCSSKQYCGPTCEIICQDGCVSQQCSQSCSCVKGCNTNYWGEKCQHLCSTNCIKPSNPNNAICDSTNGTCLHGCIHNRTWGNECDTRCSDGCVSGVCQQWIGNCTEGCTSNTLYGWRCDGECSRNCIDGTCDRVKQYCIEGCTKGNYGELCDKACNKNCINSTCKRENGSCDNGCIIGNYGDQCETRCSDKCLQLRCERIGGNCTSGCISGYHGFHCLNVIPITTPKPNVPLSNNWVYVAIGCGALVALGVMATIVLVTKKRRQIAKRRRTSRMSKIPDEKVLEETQRRQKRKAEGTGARLTQLFVENPLARFMKDRSHGGELITKTPLRDILGRVIKMDEDAFSREFDELKTGLTKSHEASRKIDNLALNFFGGIYPYDDNRVVLKHSLDEEDVKRKSKVKRGILKSVHFTTFGHNRDSTYEVLEADRKESENENGNQSDANIKRMNKGGKDRSNGYSSVVFNIKDETGDDGLREEEKKGVDDYATVDISGSGKPSTSGTDAEPSDYAKVTYGDKTKPLVEGGLDDSYDHINRDKNGGKAQTEQANNEDETCEYSVVHKDKDGPHDQIVRNESGESTHTDQPKDDDQCDYAVVHKEKKGQGEFDNTDEEDVRKRKPEITMEKDGSVTIKKDYINASLIKGYNQNEKYIAAQAPSKVTANDFWIMAWEQKSSFIIMLTEILEEGLSRCEKYWPELDNQETYGDITVTCYDCKQYADYTVRLLRLSLKNGHEREIVHLQFTAWPQEGCPVSAIDYIQFHQKYRSLTKGRLGKGATIVHCTAGVGRTGVFIALDILVEEGLDSLSVDVYKCVVALREQRVDMVRTIDQYEFLYKAVAQTFALEAQPCHKVRLQDKLTELKRFDHDSGKSKMELLYQSLKASLVLDTAEIATVDVLQERRSKDRPTSDVPDVLFRPDLPRNIYINAVIFESLRKKEAIVATQMPTPDTLQDFCQLLVYHQCATVIMLNPIDPNDKSIGTYWPTAKTPVVAGKMIVSQLSIEKESDYIIRQLRIHTPETNDDDTPAHEVTMIQYKGWKIVKNVPNAKNMLKLLQVCRRYIEDLPDKRLLIHCMNGAEQSGLFCALVNLLEIADIEDEISVTSVVRKILARRPNALPSVDQFEMCFAAACEYIKKA